MHWLLQSSVEPATSFEHTHFMKTSYSQDSYVVAFSWLRRGDFSWKWISAKRILGFRLNILCSIQCVKVCTNSYMLLYVSETDDGFMKCMELSLEDWFPILPRSWLHLYSMPVAPWPLVLLWCGRQKHKPGWGREREGWGIAKGETVYNGRGVEIFLVVPVSRRDERTGWGSVKKTGMSLQGAARTNEAIIWQICESLHWGRVGGGWAERKLGWGEKGSGVGGGLGEGMTVARADRDVSAASVISRRLAAARGHRGAHESRDMIEQTTPTILAGGQAVWTNQSGKK